MDTIFKRTIKVLLSIFHWRGMCFQADCPKPEHFKTLRTIIILSSQIGYIINSTHAHLCAHTPPSDIQHHIVYLLLVELDHNFFAR